MRGIVLSSVDTLFNIFFWLIIIRSLLSWIRPAGYAGFWADLNRTLEALTEPILAPIRNAMPSGGMGLDLSPLVAILLLEVVHYLAIELILRL